MLRRITLYSRWAFAGKAESHQGIALDRVSQSTLLNPFVVGGALRSADGYGFFGREDVFTFVKRSLDSVKRVPVILYGHRRIGKSSILRQLTYKLSTDLVCVYHDLQGSTNDTLDDALHGLAREIAGKLGAEPPDPAETTADSFETKFLRRVVGRVGDPRRLVLLLDEFDAVDERKSEPNAAAGNFISFLGRLISNELNFGLVLVLGRRTSELSDRFKSSLLKDSVQMRIGRLTDSQVTTMIHALADPHLSFRPEATNRIIELAAGHPFCSQVLCYAVWNRCIDKKSEVTAADVDAATTDAISLGANGMTWIYDGLQLAEQRLFLSTLSETCDPLSGRASSLEAIQNFLREHGLSLGQADLDSAARDLISWDIITGSNNAGYRFVVPLLGAWVRRERPVFLLEQEVRFANARAWTFYELARESEQRDDLDAAILGYRDALRANPVFLQAQRRLATALARRGKPGDLLAAIEAWERVLESDAAAPRTELLEVLLRAVETTQKTSRLVGLFQKIQSTDNTGQFTERAARIIRERAAAKMSNGRMRAVRDAAELFDVIGDSENGKDARTVHSRMEKTENLSMLTFFCAIGVAIGLGYLPLPEALSAIVTPPLSHFRIFLCAFAGTCLFWEEQFHVSQRFLHYRNGLLGLAAGLVGGELARYLSGSVGAGAGAAWFVAFVVVASAAPALPALPPDDDLLAPPAASGGLMFQTLDFVVRNATEIRDRLAKRRGNPREERT